MLEDRRKYERFAVPLVVSFRPTHGAADYVMGLMKNFSCEGLALEVKEFSFITCESLEMNLRFPQSGTYTSLFGNVAWKSQAGNTSTAGVRFREVDEAAKNQIVGKISSVGNIPLDRILAGRENKVSEETGAQPASGPGKKREGPSKNAEETGFIKEYLESGFRCRVTFRLPKEAAPDAGQISVVGDFNEWDPAITPMQRLGSGDFQVTMELISNREYRFRYLVDSHRWENHWSADRYDPNDFGTDDSVVIL